MSRFKKVTLFALAALLLTSGLWLYWEWEMPVRTTLPESNCTRVQMYGYFFDDYVSFTPDADAAAQILSAMEGIEVNRGPKWSTFNGDAFGIWLYFDGEEYPTTLSLCEDGRMCVQDFETDKSKYYEGAQELFQRVLTITQNFSAETLREE